MDRSVLILEDMLFRTLSKEIEERYEEVISLYKHDPEIKNIANTIKRLCDYVLEIYKNIPDPTKKLDDNLYSTLYYLLKDLGLTLYDLTIAEGEQLYYVISSAYQKISGANALLERLV
ncbi:hypothetical protein [Thermocrinis jamiesonii]|jgi:hypothetical protein|uniref:hypothetical protein n=1 Tax=Thermocrinis jamiesonii TaxID=1302351 RepID=UPI0004954102|nr:hypothetical protein [Thermocrinis jamiesonii]